MRFNRIVLPSRRRVALAAVALSGVLAPSAALAQVDVVGDVRPSDNPFTLSLSEGLQANGATVQVGTLANPPDVNKTGGATGELNGFLDNTGANFGQPFYEQNLNVIIGENSSGEVSITNEAILRNAHLVLGGSAEVDPAAPGVDVNVVSPLFSGSTSGFGVLRISGFGSTYNNHPQVVPTLFQDPGDSLDTRFNVPDEWNFGDLNGNLTPNEAGERFTAADAGVSGTSVIKRQEDLNFDAYIGLTGQGLLEITDGGRAEIQDAVVIGYGPQAIGEVYVAGSGSSLTAFGDLSPTGVLGGGASPFSQLIVGAYGTGLLRIEEGGTVRALRGAAIGVTESSGEHIIGAPESDDFDRGGRGTVIVDGLGSLWDIDLDTAALGTSNSGDAALAIGEFVAVEEAASLEPNYASNPGDREIGQGTLIISNGGRVRLRDPTGGNDDDADLRIGRFGELRLAAGALEVQDEIYNDGVVSGGGEVLAGRFLNRSLGEVRIAGGQHLILTTDAGVEMGDELDLNDAGTGADPSIRGLAVGAPTNFFGANFGSIQVIGDEATGVAIFEYRRADDSLTPPPAGTETRFINGHRTNTVGGTTPPNEFGEIIVNNGHLHFRAGTDLTDANDGILNLGVIAFVGGDNLVTGTVDNAGLPMAPPVGPIVGPATLTPGTILIDNTAGGDTFVTFADGIVNGGLIQVASGAGFLALPGSLPYSGDGTLRLLGEATASVLGDFQLGEGLNAAMPENGGTLELIVDATGSPTLAVAGNFVLGNGAEISVEGDFGAAAAAGDIISLISVGGQATGLAGLTFSSVPIFDDPDLAAFLDFDADVGLFLEVRSISGSTAAGADFNGDGTIDQNDVDIFAMFFGLEAGGSVFTGDLNGDGMVNAADFFLLQELFPGATLPSVAASTTVPEPAAAGLLLLGLAAAGQRRRR